MDESKIVVINYTNWKGVTALRKIIPKKIFFGSTEWHKEEQWLLEAYDVDKNADRSFAIKDIKSWEVKQELTKENYENSNSKSA